MPTGPPFFCPLFLWRSKEKWVDRVAGETAFKVPGTEGVKTISSLDFPNRGDHARSTGNDGSDTWEAS